MENIDTTLVAEIRLILDQARNNAYSAISNVMTKAYWLIGQQIVIHEQSGSFRAEYGKQLLETISKALTKEYGKGYSVRSMRNYRQFYMVFPDFQIRQSRLPNLNWTHYLRIMRIENQNSRIWYVNEAASNNWSVRTLDRNISTLYYVCIC